MHRSTCSPPTTELWPSTVRTAQETSTLPSSTYGSGVIGGWAPRPPPPASMTSGTPLAGCKTSIASTPIEHRSATAAVGRLKEQLVLRDLEITDVQNERRLLEMTPSSVGSARDRGTFPAPEQALPWPGQGETMRAWEAKPGLHYQATRGGR